MVQIQSVDSLFNNLKLSIEKINTDTKKLTSLTGEVGFNMFSMPENIQITRLDPSEYGFKQVINLMYILFIDQNAFKLKELLKERIGAYKIPSNEYVERLILPKNGCYIGSLRTFFFHSIPKQEGILSSVENVCVKWYQQLNLNQDYPLIEEDWDKCLNAILSQLLDYLSMIENVLNIMLQQDIEDIGGIIGKWINVERMQYEFNEVKSVAKEIIENVYEFENLNEGIFCKNKISEWNTKKIEFHKINKTYTPEQLANFTKKIIDESFQQYMKKDLSQPISSNEMKIRYNVVQIQLGFYMKEAGDIYNHLLKKGMYSKDKLLADLDIFHKSNIEV